MDSNNRDLVIPWDKQEPWEFLIFLGMWLEDKDIEKSLYCYERACLDSSLARWYAARLLMKLKRYDEAIYYLEKDYDEGNFILLYMIAKCYFMKGNFEYADKILNNIIMSNPKNPAALALKNKIKNK